MAIASMKPFLRAAMVSVDYGDLLEITLPHNRHHFAEVLVVTTPGDLRTQQCALTHDCRLHLTKAFYHDGADFNKWKALEEGLDAYGRHGWMCLLDADIMWPRQLVKMYYDPDCLYGPPRLILPSGKSVPAEEEWQSLGMFPDCEFAGYTQIFHADCSHLKPAPWHQMDWRHAGGGDTFFQAQWPKRYKIRTPWQVLHLGTPGQNWCGRVTPLTDGTQLPGAKMRSYRLRRFMEQRAKTGRYTHERL